MNFTWATATHPGRVRSNNEDRVHPDAGGAGRQALVGVADGMGGHVGGEIASKLAIETATKTDADVGERVKAANRRIIEEVAMRPDLLGMGTTLTLIDLTAEAEASIAHVGDSRAYLLRDDEMRQLTTDHTVVNEYLAAGKISADDIPNHPQRHMLTRALGLTVEIDVDVLEEPIRAGDRFLICSDGLNGMMPDRNIHELLGEGTPEEAVWALVEAANSAGGYDNISVVVVDVEQ